MEKLSNTKAELNTVWKVSKYGVYSGPYFSLFGLNTEIYSVNLRIQSEYGKIRPEKTSYLDTFHTVDKKGCLYKKGVYSFLEHVAVKGNLPEKFLGEYLINLVTCFFAYH